MESLQGPLNSCFFGESHLELNYLEQQGLVLDSESALRLEEEEEQVLMISSLEDNMPFLQMLQSVEYSPNYSSQQQCFFPFKDPTNFQTLLRLQHLKNHNNNNNNNNNNVQELDQKSCVTHDVMVEMQQQQQQQQQSHSPVKSESYELHQQHHQASASASCCVENNNNNNTPTKAITAATEKCGGRGNSNTQEVCQKSQQVGSVATTTRERKKRKRTRPAKNKEDVENQRMTHIAVERNRRRQMNDHLSVLRSLMPPSYIQRGDQASIIGGAIDFVKELEQLLQSLEAQKRMRRKNNNNSSNKNEDAIGFGSSSNSSSTTNGGYDGIMRSSTTSLSLLSTEEGNFGGGGGNGDELKAENKSESAEIEVTLIQTHVNLKIQCKRRHGQLVKAIVALEDLRLSILHLNITSSSDDSVLYSLNLKIEEGCRLRSANEIAEAVHHIFNFING